MCFYEIKIFNLHHYHCNMCNLLLALIVLENKTSKMFWCVCVLCVCGLYIFSESHAWQGISLAFETEKKKKAPNHRDQNREHENIWFVYLRSEFRNENIRRGHEKGVKNIQLHWWDFSTWIAFRTLYNKWHLIAHCKRRSYTIEKLSSWQFAFVRADKNKFISAFRSSHLSMSSSSECEYFMPVA